VRNNLKSPWGCRISGQGDRGQRFMVYCKDGTNRTMAFGYAETEEGRDSLLKSIALHPVLHSSRVVDRKAKP